MAGHRIALVVVALALALARGASAASAAPAAAPPVSVFQDDDQMLRAGPEARDRALDELAALGVDVVRVIVVWRDAQADPGLLDRLDAVDAGARARGMALLLDPTGPGPAAASRCRPQREVCDPDPSAFGLWVAELGRRYPEVHRWSVWNEPNNPRWLLPQRASDGRPTSPARYRALVRAAASALRGSGHDLDLLLAGETAPMPVQRQLPATDRPVAADTFLTQLLAGSQPLGAGAIAHHPYATDLRSPYGKLGARQYTPAGAGRLVALVRQAASRGVLPRGAGVWMTELGFQTAPPDRYSGVPLARQAAWLNLAEARLAAAGVAAVGQYLLVDEGALDRFQSGLRTLAGHAKPALEAYRLPLVAQPAAGHQVLLVGRVRPARAAGVTVLLQRRDPSGTVRTLRRLTTGPGGSVRVRVDPRLGDARLTWTAPGGQVHHGRWVGLTGDAPR